MVVHQVHPYVWKLRHNPQRPNKLGDSTAPTLCFMPSEIDNPFVKWKKGISFPAPRPPLEYCDALMLRERFMELRTEREFGDFLRFVGRFSPLVEAERRYGWSLRDLIGCQEMFRELALRSPDTWNEYAQGLISPTSNVTRGIVAAVTQAHPHTIEFRWNAAPEKETTKGWDAAPKRERREKWHDAPKRKLRRVIKPRPLEKSRLVTNHAVIETTNAISAILTTIELDHLRGAKVGSCARADCPAFFEITSSHKRKYCTQYCAHLASQRRTRKRQKRAASQNRETKGTRPRQK